MGVKGRPETYAKPEVVGGALMEGPYRGPVYDSEAFMAEHDGLDFHEWAQKQRKVIGDALNPRAMKVLRWPPPHHMPGTVVSRILFGSYAYGTDTDDSDMDFRGVFLLPNEAFLGLHPPKTTFTEQPDQTYHELGHYMKLLLGGNPNIVGMLYAPADVIVERHPIWEELVKNSEAWISKATVSAYRGWVTQEWSKKETLQPKRLSHLLRLVYELEGMVTRRSFSVRLTGWQLEKVMIIKTGRATLEDVDRELANMLHEIDQAIEANPLPEPPTDLTQDLLLTFRRQYG